MNTANNTAGNLMGYEPF